LGWVDRERLPDIYSSADLLVFPSRFDTFGCTVLEAMSCGLPVAAFRTKGPRDLIQDTVNGILVDDVEGLSVRIIQSLLDMPALARMGKAAMAAAGTYTPSVIMTRLMSQIGLADFTSGDAAEPKSESALPQSGGSFLEELLEIVSQE
jgi:glycosyltransferase involved in cell wall biosynthesis